MSAIVENNFYKALEQLIEGQFDPKSKQMRDFRDALMNSNISNLFFNMPGASAKIVKEETKADKKKRATKKNDDGTPKPKRPQNAYMLFLADKRDEIKQLLLEEQPELKGKELQNAITRKAGEIWKQATDEDKKPYTDKAAEAKAKKTEETKPTIVEEQSMEEDCCGDDDHPMPPGSDDENDDEETTTNANRTFLEEHKIWVDNETNLCYVDNNEDTEPIGTFTKGKLVPFKKSTK